MKKITSLKSSQFLEIVHDLLLKKIANKEKRKKHLKYHEHLRKIVDMQVATLLGNMLATASAKAPLVAGGVVEDTCH